MQMVFFKFNQRVKILQMVSNQEVTLKRLISMLPIAQKLYIGAQSDLCEMYIQQCGPKESFSLIKKKQFLLIQKTFHASKSF